MDFILIAELAVGAKKVGVEWNEVQFNSELRVEWGPI